MSVISMKKIPEMVKVWLYWAKKKKKHKKTDLYVNTTQFTAKIIVRLGQID